MQPFPIHTTTPVTYPGPQPATSDIVVIGGGIIGVCTALFLAREGHSVTLLEKGRIAAEQSSRNWGWIRQQGRDPDEMPIMAEAQALWRELAGQTNVDIGLRQGGIAYLAQRPTQLAGYEDWLPHARANGADSRMMTAAEVSAMFPGLATPQIGALITPSDMRAEPWVAVPALAGIAAREGVQIIENCAVRCLDIAAGRVAGVITEHGRIASSQVVLAGGAWSALFLRNHGISMPQLSVRENVAATESLPEIYAGAVSDGRVAFRRREDGGYTLAPPGAPELFVGPDAFRALPHYLTQLRADPFGQRLHPFAPKSFPDAWTTKRRWQADTPSPFEAMRILNPAPNMAKIRRLLRDFSAMFPDLGPIKLKSAWAGMIDTMPDIVPVVDTVAALPGLTIGTGMSGHGFGIGPGMGRVLARLATGQSAGHDLTRFRLARFTDGSPMILGPNV
ncbi:NAD(P)/FAD-dependent oxidoreductase [Sulfitobacter pontiacus]|jgi:glycine/D-amino acid oxidase-like deaminating enzyme|uniref:NAD(P)/FAD-dependent oxidoreductase n=1 Tax=Sulfitobacter pontiacus TaxID=60137 RepID=UPI0030EBA0FB